jgi:hypothetical protein
VFELSTLCWISTYGIPYAPTTRDGGRSPSIEVAVLHDPGTPRDALSLPRLTSSLTHIKFTSHTREGVAPTRGAKVGGSLLPLEAGGKVDGGEGVARFFLPPLYVSRLLETTYFAALMQVLCAMQINL